MRTWISAWISAYFCIRMGASREEIAAEAMRALNAYERAQQQVAELEALAEVGVRETISV